MRIVFFIVRQHQHIPIHQQKQPTSRSGQIPGMKWTGFIRTANLL